MNKSEVQVVRNGNLYEAQYKPVWAASFRKVEVRGRVAAFDNKADAEVAAWRVLNAIEQSVMRRDGEMVFAAKSNADALFNLKPKPFARNKNGKIAAVERRKGRR